MRSESDIRTITYLQARAADLLSQVNETHPPVVITQKTFAKGESDPKQRSFLEP